MNFDFDFLDKKEFNFKLLFLIIGVIGIAFYTGFLIYGDKGLNELLELQSQEKKLQFIVDKLQKENMKLQKEYFELKDIEGNE